MRCPACSEVMAQTLPFSSTSRIVILIQVFRLRYAVIPELNVKGVGVVEVAYSLRQLFGRYPYATEWSSSRRILRSAPHLRAGEPDARAG